MVNGKGRVRRAGGTNHGDDTTRTGICRELHVEVFDSEETSRKEVVWKDFENRRKTYTLVHRERCTHRNHLTTVNPYPWTTIIKKNLGVSGIVCTFRGSSPSCVRKPKNWRQFFFSGNVWEQVVETKYMYVCMGLVRTEMV